MGESKYIKLCVTEPNSKIKFVEIGERIRKNEVKFAYYTVENDIGYHYYIIL